MKSQNGRSSSPKGFPNQAKRDLVQESFDIAPFKHTQNKHKAGMLHKLHPFPKKNII